MKRVRNNIFETNSSSTHAIVIPKQVNSNNYMLYDSLDHDYAFGREECRLCYSWDEKLAYAYMLLRDNNVKELDIFKNQVIEIWKELFGNTECTPIPKNIFDYIDRDDTSGNLTGEDNFLVLRERYENYVDHVCGLEDKNILDKLINDKEFVKRFIFNTDSYITIGSDEFRGYNIKTIGFEYDYDNEDDFLEKLKEYKEENDVYLKGN